MHSQSLSALTVRSRNSHLPEFSGLVRGVSNTQVGLARLAHINC